MQDSPTFSRTDLGAALSATNVVNNIENPNGSERYRSNSEISSDSGIPSLDEITEAAESLAGTLGEKVRFVRDVDEIQEENPNILRRKRQSKGWFNPKTGEIVVVLPNAESAEDVMATILHETVGHKGLREVVGEDKFNDFIDKIFASASVETRRKIVALMKENGWDSREATEEYIAGLAESGFTDREERTFFEMVNDFFRDLRSRP